MTSGDADAGGRGADVALAQRVLDGDASAQGVLLDRLLPHLRAVARAILSNAADIDDAVQLALMRVLKGLSGYRGQASLVRWARRVAAHACLRFRDDNRRRLRVVQPSAEPEAHRVANHAATPDGLPPEIAHYLEQLPDKQREALVLRHVLEYTVSEIAELVGAPVDTVKSRLLYARRAMRAQLRRRAAVEPGAKRVMR
ncbi:MAG: RNA polymerase sigma factor [Myxococcota bacterium]